jgi:hypothetical protein
MVRGARQLSAKPLDGEVSVNLEIQTVWSPDLDPPTAGEPADLRSFDLLMQVSLGELDKPGGEVFSFSVCSPDQLQNVEHGQFLSHVLVLESFSWAELTQRLQKLLRHTQTATSWAEVISALSGCLRHSA